MIDYKIVLGYLTILLACIAHIPYLLHVFSNKTKPHAFSWLVWSILSGIAFAASLVRHGGAGSWIAGFTAMTCLVIFLLSLWKGTKDFPLIDWICIALAGVSLWLWWLTKDPTLSVITIVVTDTLAYVPTFRKSYHQPFQETASVYMIYFFIWILALFALGSYSIATWLYPVYGIVSNAAIVSFLVWRRKVQQHN
ncbi:hypothetical protein HYS47_00170 [Candidatus Woesearchaeota archaeon]|nr:hypothetical protein [Candidatus Woesearchaeota archaeon]